MKKGILPVLIGMMLIAMFGCAAPAQEDSDTLTLMGISTDLENNYVQRIIDLYEEKTGKKIELIGISHDDWDQETKKVYAGDNQPDLLFHFNNSALESLDIPEHFYYLNDQPWVDELTTSARLSVTDSEGNVLGLPFWENSLSGCYYNKTMLDELGLQPATTQAEFDALCSALKTIGQTPLFWGAADSGYYMFQFGLDPIFADNPELLEKLNKNEITYADIPEVRQMVEWLDNANKQGWFNEDFATAGWNDMAPSMANGDAAALLVWDTWFKTDFSGAEGKYTADDFALMPVFLNTTPNGTYEGGNINMLMVNKNSPRLETALAFLDFCAAPENYNDAFDGVPTGRSFNHQTTNVQEQMVVDAQSSVDANIRPSIAWPKIIGYNQRDTGHAILQMFLGEVDVDGCIALMDESRIANAKDLGAEGF